MEVSTSKKDEQVFFSKASNAKISIFFPKFQGKRIFGHRILLTEKALTKTAHSRVHNFLTLLC